MPLLRRSAGLDSDDSGLPEKGNRQAYVASLYKLYFEEEMDIICIKLVAEKSTHVNETDSCLADVFASQRILCLGQGLGRVEG